jgi:predicted nucleic acid-binding protein
MVVYLDTSALVKLFVAEPGDELVHELVEEASAVVTSRVAYAEACAALTRSRREGRLDESHYKEALTELKAKWPDFAAVQVDELAAGELAVQHALRGFDAIHLAAALRIRGSVGKEPVTFATFDARQATAARAESFRVLPEPRAVKSRASAVGRRSRR